MPGPLTGIRVLDATRVLAGPFCTMTLRDLGAEVVKVEHPFGGDTARGNRPVVNDISAYFLSVNRGKRSLTMDLATDQGRDLFIALARKADVVVENFVPGAMKRFGLDYPALSAVNPRLVYCSISGFGQTGPKAHLPALDVIVQGMGGVMSYTGEPGGPPVRPGVSIGDIAAGLYGAIGILSALMERAVSGKGQCVDISMLDCQVAIQEHAFSRYLNAGDIPKPLGTRHPIFTPFQAFEAKDGWVVVAIVGGRNDQWPLFCATIGRLDLIDPPEYRTGHDRTLHYDKLEPILREAFKQKTVDEWIAAFQAVEIACGPVNTIDKVVADPQVQAREMFVEARDASGKVYTLLNTPVKLSRTPGRVDRISPGLGEHTADVLRDWLGLGKDEVERLRREGVL